MVSLDIHVPVLAAGGTRSPLTVRLDFTDGKLLVFSADGAEDVGDYVGPFVHQKCLRQHAIGNGDYRDGFVVFFRPDAAGDRIEIVVEYGSEVDLSGSKPATARGIAAAHAPGYTATISGGNLAAPVVAPPVLQHWYGTRWRWQSSMRPLVRAYADLVAMRAIFPLDATLLYGAPKPATHAWQSPMDTGGLVTGMGTTGDRPDIGPITDWQGRWLLTGDPAMETSWRAGAEAVGSMPFWVRDVATGNLVDLGAHPLVSFSDANHGPHQLPMAPVPVSPTYFKLDASHMPAAAFVPWLLTDDPYFLEGAQATANYGICAANYYPLNQHLPLMAYAGQPRGLAWSVRDIFRMAMFSPDVPPSWLLPRDYWRKSVADTLVFCNRYVTAAVSPCTTVFKLLTITNAFETFMMDYLTIMFAWAKWSGQFPEWDGVLDYVSTTRLALSDHTGGSGWDHRYQVPYYLPVWDARKGAAATLTPNQLYNISASPDTPTSWGELSQCYNVYAAAHVAGWTDPSTWPPDQLIAMSRYYLPEARAALAALALSGSQQAAAEHAWLKAHMDAQFPLPGGSAYKWAIPPA